MSGHLSPKRFPLPLAPAAVAADWRARGFSCETFVDPPGREWNGFRHDCNELMTVLQGRLEVEIAGERFLAEPGDELFIPKGALHCLRNCHSGTTRWLYGYD